MRPLVFVFALLAAVTQSASAEEAQMPVPGDCAMCREGGEGYIMKTPTYWVRGRIEEVYKRPHQMGLCPRIGKPRERFTRDDWMTIADTYPCVSDPANVGEVQAIRIRMRVEAWETPWSLQQGRVGWLFRGQFLKTELKEGVILDVDGTLLERCEEKP